jgi:NSS family neurotransmitter:Na+ symporter
MTTDSGVRRPGQHFSTHLTTLLTMAGLAIGLGNVWRFPYMMGQHGGSAFLFIYLFFMLLLAVPALTAEWALGRATEGGPVAAFKAAFGAGPGLVIGLVLVFSAFMAVTYYSIVVANVVYSAWFAISQGFEINDLASYQAGLSRAGTQYAVALGVMCVSLWIIHRGLRRGIEVVNRTLVPLFGAIAIYMVWVALNLDGAIAHLRVFLQPDFSRAGPSVWFAAMGQACFSVGLSGVLAVMYGSYLRRREALVSTAAITGLMDTGAALLGTLFVVPAVLVFGLDMAAGPGLLFDTLPRLFAVMPGGAGLAALFLVGWAMVAVLSVIGTTDAIIGGLAGITGERWSRQRWIWTIGGLQTAVMAPIAWHPEWIGTLDMVFGSGMFMLGSLLAVVGVGWGLGKGVLSEQIRKGLSPAWHNLLLWWTRFVVPLALFIILGGYILTIMGVL